MADSEHNGTKKSGWGLFKRISDLMYLLIGGSLISISVFSIWIAIKTSLAALGWNADLTLTLLTSVGLVVLALAIFDVGKYLIEEEVFRHRELRETGEVRQSLTKFVTILIIAFGLEALVYVFKAGRSLEECKSGGAGLEGLFYPTLLIVAIAILLVVLGWYQSISTGAEVKEKAGLPLAEKGLIPATTGKEPDSRNGCFAESDEN